MLQRILFSIALAGLLFGASAARGQSINSLDGTWGVDRGIFHGQVVPLPALQSMTLVLSSGTFKADSGALSSSGRLGQTGAEENQIDFMINSGADAGRTIRAIYRFENQTLTITYSETAEFPNTFDSTADNKYLTLVYRKRDGSGATGATAGTTSAPGATGSSGSGAGAGVID